VRDHRPVLRLALVGLMLIGAAWRPPVAWAAGYTLVSAVNYWVDPDARRIEVSVEVTFTNITPDPAGSVSAFPQILLAVHPGVSAPSASDAEGDLAVALEPQVDSATLRITPRAPVRFDQSVTFAVRYELLDGDPYGTHVRPQAVGFPAWAFGTSASVSIGLPIQYEVSVDGDPLTPLSSRGVTTLHSGPIPDPEHWLALISASAPATYATISASVPLSGATVDLQVRHWTDDAAWGRRVRDLLIAALPRLESEVGLPYPLIGPLLVVESVPGPEPGTGSPLVGGAEIGVAFDAPDFTILHQAAHIWVDAGLARARWIREGLASYFAAQVARAMQVEPAYDPRVRTEELAAGAFALDGWSDAEGDADASAYGYAASWAVTEEIALAVGESRLRLAVARVAAGIDPYQPVGDVPAPGGRPTAAIDSRTWLDHLEQVSHASVSDLFAASVLDAESRSQLGIRSATRDAFAGLLEVAGDWGAPEPVRVALTDWRFDEAQGRIDAALGWIADRDALAADAAALELRLPDRLRDRYRVSGGDAEAYAELEAERAVLDAYREVRDLERSTRGTLEQIGLVGTPPPDQALDQAAAVFGEGDLLQATLLIGEARSRLDSALLAGVLRVVGASAIGLALVGLATWSIRRRRRADYTARP
jgi:hypothetical protein